MIPGLNLNGQDGQSTAICLYDLKNFIPGAQWVPVAMAQPPPRACRP
jgi:hypothetical protein